MREATRVIEGKHARINLTKSHQAPETTIAQNAIPNTLHTSSHGAQLQPALSHRANLFRTLINTGASPNFTRNSGVCRGAEAFGIDQWRQNGRCSGIMHAHFRISILRAANKCTSKPTDVHKSYVDEIHTCIWGYASR